MISLVGSCVRGAGITVGFVGSCISGVRTTVCLVGSLIRGVGITVGPVGSCMRGMRSTVSMVGSSIRGVEIVVGSRVGGSWERRIMTVFHLSRVGSRVIGVRTWDSLAIVVCGR